MTLTKSSNISTIKPNNGFNFSLGEVIGGSLFDISARF
jgi:hypothetical protein